MTNPEKKWTKNFNKQSSKQGIQMVNKYMKKRLTSGQHQGNVIQNHKEISPHSERLKSETQRVTNAGKDVGKGNAQLLAGVQSSAPAVQTSVETS